MAGGGVVIVWSGDDSVLADVETWRLAFAIVMLAAAVTSGLWLPLVDAALIGAGQ